MKLHLLPMVRLFLFQCLMTMVLAMPFSNAHAQYNGGYGQQQQTVHINSYLNNYDQINLSQRLNLGQILRYGTRIQSLTVTAQSTQYNSSLVLEHNGYIVDQVNLSSYMGTLSLQVPSYLNQYDSLVLKVRGGAYVQSASVRLSGHGGGNGGGYGSSVQVNVNRSFYGSQRVDLISLLGYNPRIDPNQAVEAITVVAHGQGSIMVTGGGMSQGSIQVDGYYGSTSSVRVLGLASAKDIKMRITGNITIQTIRVQLKRGYGY